MKKKFAFLLLILFELYNLLASDNDTIIISDTAIINIIDLDQAIYCKPLDSYFIINWYDPNNSKDNRSIFKLDEQKNLDYFVTDTSVHSVQTLCLLNKDIYTIDDYGVVKGYDCIIGNKIFEKHPYGPAMELWGMCTDGDSLLYITDSEWDLIYKVNVNNSTVKIIETLQDFFVHQGICYDQKNHRLLVLQYNNQIKGTILSIDLKNDNKPSTIYVDSTKELESITIDKNNAIYLTCEDECGIYRFNISENSKLEKITNYPTNPGKLTYSEDNNSIIVPDREKSILYIFQLGEITQIEDPILDNAFHISKISIHPNPVKGNTTISLDLKMNSDVRIDIFDSLGKYIKTLYNSNMSRGENNIFWKNNCLPPGYYYIITSINNDEPTTTMVLLE